MRYESQWQRWSHSYGRGEGKGIGVNWLKIVGSSSLWRGTGRRDLWIESFVRTLGEVYLSRLAYTRDIGVFLNSKTLIPGVRSVEPRRI